MCLKDKKNNHVTVDENSSLPKMNVCRSVERDLQNVKINSNDLKSQ